MQTVDHDEAIQALLAVIRSPDAQDAGARQRWTAHIAACSDCWAVLRQVHVLGLGAEPDRAREMASLFGCEPVQERFAELSRLDASELHLRDPESARHLSWCIACRERFMEYQTIEAAAARGEFDTAVVSSHSNRASSRSATIDLAERLVVRIGEKLAGFSLLPKGFELGPVLAPVAVRGSMESTELHVGRDVYFTLTPSPDRVHLRVRPHGKDKIDLEVRLQSEGSTDRVASLRSAEPGEALLAARTLRVDERVVFEGIRPGSYVIRIAESAGDQTLSVHLDVKAEV